jgi:hypothetical protein
LMGMVGWGAEADSQSKRTVRVVASRVERDGAPVGRIVADDMLD